MAVPQAVIDQQPRRPDQPCEQNHEQQCEAARRVDGAFGHGRGHVGGEIAALAQGLGARGASLDRVVADNRQRSRLPLAPVDVGALTGLASFHQRRVIRNGQLNAISSTNWATTQVTSTATYNTSQPTTLSAVANVANVPVGSLVTGTGVGREVYVTSKNVGAGTITCNYDGEHKHQTIIEDGAFIGSDSQLVAPVRIGAGAYVAAGQVVVQIAKAGLGQMPGVGLGVDAGLLAEDPERVAPFLERQALVGKPAWDALAERYATGGA